MKIAERYNMFD